jgi:hypothetical protein
MATALLFGHATAVRFSVITGSFKLVKVRIRIIIPIAVMPVQELIITAVDPVIIVPESRAIASTVVAPFPIRRYPLRVSSVRVLGPDPVVGRIGGLSPDASYRKRGEQKTYCINRAFHVC